jgi:sugar phosphate isomerase/epimerase
MNRRQLLAGGTALALPLCAAGGATHFAASPLSIGLATFRFPDHTNQQLAQLLAREGIKVVQLFLSQKDSSYWVYNGRSDLSEMTPARCQAIAETYRSAGISIHSIGVYTNLIHPDAAEREQNLAYFGDMMKIARAMGVDQLVTEAGHYHPEGPAPQVEYHFRDDVWKTAVATGKQLGQMAEEHGVTVLLEPYYRGLLTSAKRTRLLLEEIGSMHVAALLDPANLLEVNDLHEMFEQLEPWIKCLHAKDRKLHTLQGVPAGQGDVDYLEYVKLVAKHTPHAPLILEYVDVNDYQQAVRHLRGVIDQAGLTYQ